MSKYINVAIVGATGYIGLELIKLLIKHPKVKIKNICAQRSIGESIHTFDPSLKKKSLPKINENEFVAITNVGAYGSSLSSNYNTRPLVAEILINKNKLRYIRKKQNLLKLINS